MRSGISTSRYSTNSTFPYGTAARQSHSTTRFVSTVATGGDAWPVLTPGARAMSSATPTERRRSDTTGAGGGRALPTSSGSSCPLTTSRTSDCGPASSKPRRRGWRSRSPRRWRMEARAHGRRCSAYAAMRLSRVESFLVIWSMPSVIDQMLTPRASRSSTVLMTSVAERPIRSILHTTSSSPSCSRASSANHPARDVAAVMPENRSEWMFLSSTRTSRSARRWKTPPRSSWVCVRM